MTKPMSSLKKCIMNVFSTCGTVGSIYKLKLKHGHYSHVFVDEAGHMTEPECLVPLGNSIQYFSVNLIL